MYLKKYVYLNERNKQAEYLVFWLVNRLEQTIHLNKYIHLNCLVQFILLKGNNTQTSLSEALRRHPFVNRSFVHLFEVDKFVEPFVLEPAFFWQAFVVVVNCFLCLFVWFFFVFFRRRGKYREGMIVGFLDGNIVMIVAWNYILLACVAGSFVCRARKWAAKADSQFPLNGSLEKYLN